jgi:hypothetical protein
MMMTAAVPAAVAAAPIAAIGPIEAIVVTAVIAGPAARATTIL